MATVRKLLYLLAFSISLCGCTHSITSNELDKILIEHQFVPIDMWWYAGSDENYHYMKNNIILTTKYRLPKNELKIAAPFNRTRDKSKWVLFHDLEQLQTGKPQIMK